MTKASQLNTEKLDLYCGVILTDQLNSWLNLLSPNVYQQLLDPTSGYLQKINFPTGDYLGKWIGPTFNSQDIELAESNIHSILKRYCPHFNPKDNPIYLLTGQNPS